MINSAAADNEKYWFAATKKKIIVKSLFEEILKDF